MASKRRREQESRSSPEPQSRADPQSSPEAQSGAEPQPSATEVADAPLWALSWNPRDGLKSLATLDDVRTAYADSETFLWVDLADPGRELLLGLSDIFRLHPLITEDILERNQRGKIELTGDVLHVVMFSLSYAGEIASNEIDMILGERFLLTGHEGSVNLREAPFMRRDPGAHLAGGPDFTLWAISDWIVDDYFPVFDRMGDEIDELEDDVMRRPSGWIVERLFQVRRELLTIRRAVNPQREIFNQLTNRDLRQIRHDRIIYFRDVYDHLIRLTDELDSYRELVSTALDIYLSQVNNKLSEIVRRLTAVTVVLAGAGTLAGIFGMSEAGLALGFADLRFWVVAGAIGAFVVLGLVYFRRIGWI